MRIAIIGSGIAGLSTAIALRKVGIEPVVYERAAELREVGAGISLWANALRALDHMGVGDLVRQHGVPLVRSELRADEGRRIQLSMNAERLKKKIGTSPILLMLHRADLIGVLAKSIPPDTVRYGHECAAVEPAGNRVAIRFKNGHADEADAVIGADGIRSAVRASLFGMEPPRYSGYVCWRGVCPRPASIASGYFGEWWGRGKRFGITSLSHDRVYWFAVYNAAAGKTSAADQPELASLFAGWADPVQTLIATTPPAQMVYGEISDRKPTKTWSIGRIGLIGDAAHPMTPNLGQGGCTAIEDAVAIARALATIPDPATAFATFARQRNHRTAWLTNESWRLGTIAHWEGRISCRLRDALLGVVLPLVAANNMSKPAAFDIGPLPDVS